MEADAGNSFDVIQQVAGELLERVDWERLTAGRDAALVAALFVRRHPWVLIAAGATLTALGVLAVVREAARQRAEGEERALLDVPARASDGGNGA